MARQRTAAKTLVRKRSPSPGRKQRKSSSGKRAPSRKKSPPRKRISTTANALIAERRMLMERNKAFVDQQDDFIREFLPILDERDKIGQDNNPLCTLNNWLELGQVVGKGSYGEARLVCLKSNCQVHKNRLKCKSGAKTPQCKHQAILKSSYLKDVELEYAWFNESTTMLLFTKADQDTPSFVGTYWGWTCPGAKYTVGYNLIQPAEVKIERELTKPHGKSVEWWREFLMQMAVMFEELNRFHINHNDLHPGNVLLIHPNNGLKLLVKVIDWGGASSNSKQYLKLMEPLRKTLKVKAVPTFFYPNGRSEYKANSDMKTFFGEMKNAVKKHEFPNIPYPAQDVIFDMAEAKEPTPNKMHAAIIKYFG